jgi:hypothetical protein
LHTTFDFSRCQYAGKLTPRMNLVFLTFGAVILIAAANAWLMRD